MIKHRIHLYKKLTIVFGVLFLIFVFDLKGFQIEPIPSESEINALFKDVQISSLGTAVIVLKNGKTVFKQGYGKTKSYGELVTSDTVFQIASVSKQFTAFSILMLAEKGALVLDDDIRKYLPEVPSFGKTITIQHLISHTSGLRDYSTLFKLDKSKFGIGSKPLTGKDVLRVISRQQELNHNPGEEYSYTNTGYCLLSEIVARITGQSFSNWTTENIFKPLHMNNTQFGDEISLKAKNVAKSHFHQQGVFYKIPLNSSVVGSTNLFTTVNDLAKWLTNFEEKTVGGEVVIQRMQKKALLNDDSEIQYAAGLIIQKYKGLRTFGHSGWHKGFRSTVLSFPNERLSIVVLTNTDNLNPYKKATQIADLFIALKTSKPVVPKASDISYCIDQSMLLSELQQITGDYKIVETNQYRRIYLKGSQLYYNKGYGKDEELKPLGDGRFILINENTTFKWILTDLSNQGEEFGLFRWNLNGEPSSHLERLNRWLPTKSELETFTGNYYSPELENSYTITVENGVLKTENLRFIPMIKDDFICNVKFLSNIKAVRDKTGKLTGLRLSTMNRRVRNLLFKKVN